MWYFPLLKAFDFFDLPKVVFLFRQNETNPEWSSSVALTAEN